MLFVFRKRLQKVYRNYKTDKLLKQQKYSQAVMFWYDILCKTIYGKENGILAFEIGHDQGGDVKNLMIEKGYYDVKVIKDLAGLDRCVIGRVSLER